MRRIYIIGFLLSSFLSFCQEDVVLLLKEKQKSSPNDVILFVDSLLLTNTNYNDQLLAEIKFEQAIAYQNNRNHRKALQLFDEILKNLNLENKIFVNILLNKSNSNVYLKKYSSAANQAIKALDIAENNHYYDLMVSANSALSFIYYASKDYIKAFEYLFNSVALQKEGHADIDLSATYNNIAILYKKIDNLEQALVYNKKSIDLSFLKNDFIGIGKSYSNIGRIYELQQEPKKAIDFYTKATHNNIKYGISNSVPYRNIGDLYMSLQNYRVAEINYLKSLDIEKENDNTSTTYIIYKDLLKIAIQKEDFEKASLYQKKMDSVFKLNNLQENKEKIKMLENQFKLFQSQKEIIEVKNSNNQKNLIFGIAVVLLFLGGLIWFQIAGKNKLVHTNEKLILEQSVLRAQMNPHFIFNSLSAIQNSLLDNDPIKSATYLSRFAKLIRQNFDFISKKTIPLSEEIDALQNYMDTQKLRFKDRFDYKFNILENVDMNSVEVPPLLIQPFVENSIEHGFKNKKEKGNILIQISKKNKHICYEIIDDGVGFLPPRKTKKIHSIDIFKKRLKLLGNHDDKSFAIQTSKKGTIIKFCLKQW